jgi:sRNA-binding carbon storage regulator CsrA
MLIVSRSKRQAVVVGEFDGFERVLKVTVLEVRGGQVRLGFEVLPDEPVSVAEAWERFPRVSRAGMSAKKGSARNGRTSRPATRRDQPNAATGERRVR